MTFVYIDMDLLDKTNPNATFWSVIRHAFVMGVIGAVLYMLVMLKDERFREHWIFGILWICLCGFIGGLFYWQIYIEHAEEESENDTSQPD